MDRSNKNTPSLDGFEKAQVIVTAEARLDLKKYFENEEPNQSFGIAINQIVLKGFSSKYSYNFSAKTQLEVDTCLHFIFLNFFKQLNAIEVSCWTKVFQQIGLNVDLVKFSEQILAREWQDVKNQFDDLSLEYLLWLRQKAFSKSELMFLAKLSQGFKMDLLNLFIHQKFSKSECSQCLDLMMDLPWGEVEIDQFAKAKIGRFVALFEWLRERKFPQAVRTEQAGQEVINQLKWPKGLKVKWQRRGDVEGMDLQFFLKSTKDYESFIESLNKNKEKLRQLPNWKSDDI